MFYFYLGLCEIWRKEEDEEEEDEEERRQKDQGPFATKMTTDNKLRFLRIWDSFVVKLSIEIIQRIPDKNNPTANSTTPDRPDPFDKLEAEVIVDCIGGWLY